jgi:hemerythrin-like domain-containing protein
MVNPIKRHKALLILSHDHHHGLRLAQLIKKGSPQYKDLPNTTEEKKDYSIKFYNDELIRHFDDEENILFPAAKGKDGETDELIVKLIDEHKKIKELVSELESDKNTEEILNQLGNLLESHIRTEERKLFMMIQNLLTEVELSVVEKQLSSSKQNIN